MMCQKLDKTLGLVIKLMDDGCVNHKNKRGKLTKKIATHNEGKIVYSKCLLSILTIVKMLE